MSLEDTVYVVEMRNTSRRIDWRPFWEPAYTRQETASKALRRVRDSYGFNGCEYRLSLYQRVEVRHE